MCLKSCLCSVSCRFCCMPFVLMHLFCSGHVSLFLQLQLAVLMTCGWLFLIVCVLCFEIMFLTLFMQLWLTLTVFRLKTLCNLWPAGKCVSTRLRKLRAMFVLMFFLNGGFFIFEPIKSNGVNSDFFCAQAISKMPS